MMSPAAADAQQPSEKKPNKMLAHRQLQAFLIRVLALVIVLVALLAVGCATAKTSDPQTPNNQAALQADKSMSRCDPNYSGCVPIASDVDCAGGGGNGPAYVEGPVTVTGKDIYGLDRDGDGVGCE